MGSQKDRPKIRHHWQIKPQERIKESEKIYSRKKVHERPLRDVEEGVEPRIVGLDIGEARIGVAISDSLGITAQPLGAIAAHDALKTLTELVSKHRIELIVIGLPITMKGERGEQALSAEEFGRKLQEATGVPTTFVDERLSSKAAERAIRDMGKKPSMNKGYIDELAAAMILQAYLDSRYRPRTEESDENI
jgi:putative Holliday junction resolvase